MREQHKVVSIRAVLQFVLCCCFCSMSVSLRASTSPVSSSVVASSIFDVLGGPKEIVDSKNPESQDDKQSYPQSGNFYNTATLKIINKQTGQLDTIKITNDGITSYGNHIMIRLLTCWQENGKKYRPEVKVLVVFDEIEETSAADAHTNAVTKFKGWLFSKSPELSYYKHDKYDFLIDSCNE